MVHRLTFEDPGFAAAFAALVDERRGTAPDVDATVSRILAAVRTEGLPALLRISNQLDGARLDGADLRVGAEEITEGAAQCPREVRDALALAARRIGDYHARQRPADAEFTDETGIELGWRWTPIDAVGIYVPGGRAAYPSSLLMNAVPAAIAGVGRIAMVTPPGHLSPAVMAAAQIAGVTEIWRVGGAQAIAALAYGAGPIAPVDKVVGPGNAYVSAAKRQVYGVVGIDALAGPSEIVVVADAANNPHWIAVDLLSQAEHDPVAQSILITDDAQFADAVAAAVEDEITSLTTQAAARASWDTHGAIIVAPAAHTADLVNALAAEHVQLAIDAPRALAAQIRHAGAIFMGRLTPEAIGDYIAGSNHVLPTSRAARYSSGLSLFDFIKRTSLIACDAGALEALGPATVALADAEGLPAHSRSVAQRMGQAKLGAA
ncbi:MAG: histidinol dehydrogenase [Caulobacter vibrioides]|uniref:Histidinol dehydrogenase n=1 Tax=Caulobacter vibrioides TaxID=155892 RepID=A0A258D8Z5_CAUVI|nr:MAG: histidinol dehydrogenase [Caulobacter vibrioides]